MSNIDMACYKESSMLNWWPKIKDLGIPVPRTEYIKVDDDAMIRMIDGEKFDTTEIRKMVERFDMPCFLRGADTSGKHSWKETCYLSNIDGLPAHIYALAEDAFMKSMMGEVGVGAIFAREFMPMRLAGFTAFTGDMPVSREVRCFINKGKKVCQHYYWFEEAIYDRGHEPTDPDWRRKLKVNNTLTRADQATIDKYLKIVCGVFKNNWSVDFCQGDDGRWLLIDMARGEVSYHHPHGETGV